MVLPKLITKGSVNSSKMLQAMFNGLNFYWKIRLSVNSGAIPAV